MFEIGPDTKIALETVGRHEALACTIALLATAENPPTSYNGAAAFVTSTTGVPIYAQTTKRIMTSLSRHPGLTLTENNIHTLDREGVKERLLPCIGTILKWSSEQSDDDISAVRVLGNSPISCLNLYARLQSTDAGLCVSEMAHTGEDSCTSSHLRLIRHDVLSPVSVRPIDSRLKSTKYTVNPNYREPLDDLLHRIDNLNNPATHGQLRGYARELATDPETMRRLMQKGIDHSRKRPSSVAKS